MIVCPNCQRQYPDSIQLSGQQFTCQSCNGVVFAPPPYPARKHGSNAVNDAVGSFSTLLTGRVPKELSKALAVFSRLCWFSLIGWTALCMLGFLISAETDKSAIQ